MEIKSVSLVMPMFNEIAYLEKSVSKAIATFESFLSDFEITIVDDASYDGSEETADILCQNDKRIRVIHHKKNRKLGGALKTGFSNATKDIIIYTDIDLPFDLSILRNFLPLISEFDIVTGYRINGRESLLRTVYSGVYNLLINFIFQIKIKDVNFSLKIFKREILNEIELKSEGSFIDAEFLAKAKRLGYSIKEVGVEYSPRTYGISRLSTPGVILKILFEMIRLYPEIKLFSRKKIIYRELKILYKKTGLKTKIYNLIRFNTCPFDVIKKFIPEEGKIVDLGCGTGLFLNKLRLNPGNRILFGFDKDKRKIKIAMESLNGGKDIKFNVENIISNDFNLPKAKCVTLIDILCYLSFNQKRDLLKKCFQALDLDGSLIIKDINKEFSLKFLWAFLQEFLTVRVFRLTSAEGLYFGNKKEYLSLLKESGFITEAHDLSKGYFYPHILYVGKKP